MSYKLEHPYSQEELNNFIVEYNHKKGLRIETFLNTIKTTESEEEILNYFALEPWEKLIDGNVINNTKEYEAQKAQEEAMRIAQLSLTKREVFLAIYQDKTITPEQIRAQITNQQALIEFDYAEKYYRGNPLIDILGQALGYTKEQLDYLFKNKTFQK